MNVTRKIVLIGFALSQLMAQSNAIRPGTRSVMDAHNCYPYGEWWPDRIDRALATGVPVAIEQDLYWYTDSRTGQSRSVLAHEPPLTGKEPGMEQYFFERIRPLVEAALATKDHSQWPLITLNLDIKTEEPEHLRAIWSLLDKYHSWLTTAVKGADPMNPQPLIEGPVMVLTGPSDAQQKVFFDDVPVGGRLLVFGAVHAHLENRMADPNIMEPEFATNYRRWWNNPWFVVEPEGQAHAGGWTQTANQRLQSLVEHAHRHGLWIRFYTVDGATEKERSANGWFRTYDFPSLLAAKNRWQAMIAAGVDYIASDQYEEVAQSVRRQ